MNRLRRRFLQLAGAAAAAPALPRRASALDYPVRQVRLIVGFAPGGSTDITARLIAQWLSEHLGQQFIIENRPGAGTNIATEAVVNSIPDGYTLLLVGASAAVNATLYDKLSFNFLRDIVPVGGIIQVPSVMAVNLSLPTRTVREFIDYAKANPAKINMASGGSGSAPHISGELFKLMTGVNMTHVPYRGEALALTDLLGGQVQVCFSSLPATIEYVRTGKVRALALTAAGRLETLPDIPTVSQFVPGYEASFWYGIGAPVSTPAEIVDKLNAEINAALADPRMKARLAELGATVLPGSPADFGKLIAAETDKWRKVIRAANIRAD
jgi:tripartite-type tricarboxylate transporter receptor subunit TctC